MTERQAKRLEKIAKKGKIKELTEVRANLTREEKQEYAQKVREMREWVKASNERAILNGLDTLTEEILEYGILKWDPNRYIFGYTTVDVANHIWLRAIIKDQIGSELVGMIGRMEEGTVKYFD